MDCSNSLCDINFKVISQFLHYLVGNFGVELFKAIQDQPHVQVEDTELDGEIWRDLEFVSEL